MAPVGKLCVVAIFVMGQLERKVHGQRPVDKVSTPREILPGTSEYVGGSSAGVIYGLGAFVYASAVERHFIYSGSLLK